MASEREKRKILTRPKISFLFDVTFSWKNGGDIVKIDGTEANFMQESREVVRGGKGERNKIVL